MTFKPHGSYSDGHHRHCIVAPSVVFDPPSTPFSPAWCSGVRIRSLFSLAAPCIFHSSQWSHLLDQIVRQIARCMECLSSHPSQRHLDTVTKVGLVTGRQQDCHFDTQEELNRQFEGFEFTKSETSYVQHTSIYTVHNQSGTIRNHGNRMIKQFLKMEQDREV